MALTKAAGELTNNADVLSGWRDRWYGHSSHRYWDQRCRHPLKKFRGYGQELW